MAKIKAEFNASTTTSNTTTATNTYSRNISAGKFGNARYVSYGLNVRYKKVRYNANCSYTVLMTGAASFPTTTEGWYYWETKA